VPYRTEWVDPELFVRHKRVAVYHTYKDDELECGTRTYWFTLSFDCGDDRCFCSGRCRNVFDVHDLPTWKEPQRPPVVGEVYDLAMYFIVDDRASEQLVTHVMRTKYRVVGTDHLLELMRRAGFTAVERLDGRFYQPVLVGSREG
jgi:hypothetical protein